MSEDESPYKAEYAKSGRASCKVCKSNIAQDSLRIARMVQSPNFDGKMPQWHHFECFFKKFLPNSCAEIGKFDGLRWDDQERIKGKIGGGDSVDGTGGQNTNFSIEYSKSSRAKCRDCENKIEKEVIRVAKMELPEEAKYGVGLIPRWRHLDCFVESRSELGASDLSPQQIPGFTKLSEEDQKEINKKFGVSVSKKKVPKTKKEKNVKVEKSMVNDEKEKDNQALKQQNQKFWEIRDSLFKSCNNGVIRQILDANNCDTSGGESRILDRCADGIMFGALELCPECKDGKLTYSAEHGYVCHGNISAWTNCNYKTLAPKRIPWTIPDELKEDNAFLTDVKLKVCERIFSSDVINKLNQVDSSTVKKESNPSMPLDKMKIVLIGRLKENKEKMKESIEELGGKLTDTINASCFCCISSPGEVLKSSAKMQKVESSNVPVVAEEYIAAIKNGGAESMLTQYAIAPWGGQRNMKEATKSSGKVKRKMETEEKLPSKKAKVVMKGGAIVDPDSGKEDSCHLLTVNGVIYTAVLGLVNLTRGSNSYYKLQILEHDKKKNRYYVFRAWGRVGTTIGGNKLEDYTSRNDAMSQFEDLYLEKTGNLWSNRKDFVKKPNCFYPIDIDYGQDDANLKSSIVPGSRSKLPDAVKELIKFIFDIEAMKDALVEFEIDLKKMPLGKLSKKQIETAYSCLSESYKLVTDGVNKGSKVLDVSNQFYTLIPHDFGMQKPPLLDNEELINLKIKMLDSLLEIEIAYNILKKSNEDEDPVDVHYSSLNTDINPISKDCDEFKMVCEYVKNTHAKTHSNYNLDVEEVFDVSRKGEKQRYRPFKDLHNRKLLWHGSRSTNYVGILSQGLRIAPPEAPVTGYMFGKGVYFADMASKSANYCQTNRSNPTGLMLLCEVALGNMYELTDANHITKLPGGKHSCKGVGKTSPDPSLEKTLPDGVTVPLGTGIESNDIETSLLYNEYIVYDTAQCNMKFLVKLKFNYKY